MISNKHNQRKGKSENLLNYDIKFPNVLVISDTGEKIGPIPTKNAIELAKNKGMDLILVSSNPKNPVAKILDYGKFKYNQKKQEKENKKKQQVINNREMRLRTNIGEHDIEFKSKKVRSFIEHGSRVKISLKFKGREVRNVNVGLETLENFFSRISDIAEIEKKPKLTNLFLDMYVIPKKKVKKGENKNAEIKNEKSIEKKSENK